jgi:general secretion pathway protein A
MYERFFNLKRKPFELVPNPDFLFLSRTHRKAKTYLEYGIKERIGFILLTGEVGSGKTTLIRNLITELNDRVNVSKVFNTRVTSEQLIAMINDDFGLEVDGRDKVTLLRDLNDYLIEQYAQNCQPVLIIDEAQNLTPDLLEETRMLSNLETNTSKLLQIILVGQPELRKTLAQPEMRQLRQRISINYHLFPMTRAEMEEYIFHRLEVAGNREAISFPDGALDIIHHYSRGIPRLMNIICDFLMLSAYVDETREVSVEMVKEIVGDLELENRYWDDEAPVASLPAREDKLGEIIDRIEKLEDDASRALAASIEREEKHSRDLSSHEEKLRVISEEIQSLKDGLSEMISKLTIDELKG